MNTVPEQNPNVQNSDPKQTGSISQTVSPHDAPPPLPPSNLKTPPIDERPLTIRSKSGNFSKIAGLVLAITIILVLAIVGYLFYQNNILKQNTVTENSRPIIIPTSSAPTPDQTSNWINYKIQILPIELRLPPGWELSESANPELGNQKTINLYSPEFEYGEDGIIKGYQLLIGPYSELTDKYTSFDQFSTVENADERAKITTYQTIQWLKYSKSAKTLYSNIPLNVAIYSNDNDGMQAEFLFNLILPSFKFATNPP